MVENSIILTSTFHDPELSLKKLLATALPLLNSLFKKIIVVLTPFMDQKSITFLESKGFIVIKCLTDSRVETYKLAYKTALEHIDNEKLEKIMYIDFDRLIHWINHYPEELQEIMTETDVDYLQIGRTSRAFETHPNTQKDTEIIVNEFGSKIFDFKRTRDIISVCHIITKKLAINILNLKNKTVLGFYCSWPILLWNWADSKKYLEVEGLEWETPDRFKKEIEKMEYEKWIMEFQNSSEWRNRVNLLHQCLIELLDLINIKFKKKS